MSRLVDFQNRIRRHLNPGWLSPSQKETYNRIQQLLCFQDTINLCGSSGVGKTFVTWVLGQEISISLYSNFTDLEAKATDKKTLAVVDPHPESRSLVRQTLSTLHGLGYRKIILVSNEPVVDQIPSCPLSLTQADFSKIYQNWSDVSIPVDLPESFESINLHEALRFIALSTLVTPGNDHL